MFKTPEAEEQGFIIPIVVIVIIIVMIFAIPPMFKKSGDNTPHSSSTSLSDTKESLAKRVEDYYLKSWGVNSLDELHSHQDASVGVRSITAFEDNSPDTVKVNIQKDVTKDEAKRVGVEIMATVGPDMPELGWIVPRGTDGLDVNVSRSDAGLPD